ncbi:MAG: hypothetical protein ACRDST_06460 [Pseudonocardiaceae bacterium]
MLKTRFSTRLAAKALVVAVTAGGGLLIGGVANAATPAGSLGTATTLPILGEPSDDTGDSNPGQIIDPVLEPILGGLLGGTGGLDPGQIIDPVLEPILGGLLGGTGGLVPGTSPGTPSTD